ncbi:uncharacterized protein LOC120913241 [Rana temporaria]|uniref:uncharacterized protein LOC120913241 n=1 Tax=Rana temporaria TaxID=8407 RepID=UPI001AAC5CD5|nr:uncharacterized protein LOC120913241 [Rana temporaria]
MTNYEGNNWVSAMSGAYQNFSQKEQKDTELFSIFFSLRKLLEKKSLNHWYIYSFEHYLKNKINPYELRIQIFPTMENIDPCFKEAWEANLQKCSAGMMSLLIEEYQRTIQKIDKELEPLFAQLKSHSNHDFFKKLDEELNEHLKQFNNDILIRKQKKLLRDQGEFSEQKAYNWKNQQGRMNPQVLSDASFASSVPPRRWIRPKRSWKSKRKSNDPNGSIENPNKKHILDSRNPVSTRIAQGNSTQHATQDEMSSNQDVNSFFPRLMSTDGKIPTTTEVHEAGPSQGNPNTEAS